MDMDPALTRVRPLESYFGNKWVFKVINGYLKIRVGSGFGSWEKNVKSAFSRRFSITMTVPRQLRCPYIYLL